MPQGDNNVIGQADPARQLMSSGNSDSLQGCFVCADNVVLGRSDCDCPWRAMQHGPIHRFQISWRGLFA